MFVKKQQRRQQTTTMARVDMILWGKNFLSIPNLVNGERQKGHRQISNERERERGLFPYLKIEKLDTRHSQTKDF